MNKFTKLKNKATSDLNHAVRFICSVPKTINLLAVVAALVLLFKIFVLNEKLELFQGMHEAGLVIESILGSIISSYVFYLIAIQLKQNNDRKMVRPHINKWAQNIIRDCKIQIKDISSASGIEADFDNITENKLGDIFLEINPTSSCQRHIHKLGPNADWINFFYYYRVQAQTNIQKIFSQIIYIDEGIIPLLNELEENNHFFFIDPAQSDILKTPSGYFSPASFFDYYTKCKNLDSYLQKHRAIK